MDDKNVIDVNLSPGQSRVKKLLERFEKLETFTAQSRNSLVKVQPRCQPISQNRLSKQTSAGIYQKRSILRRQSKSHTDIRSNGRSSVIARRRGVMSKSYSHGDQADFIAAIRFGSAVK
ncbi:unnamed protein product [Onchocerca ochengi]|uniref:Uncharacterized protein n=1 Tax=Onchocerca ochengi TaxID=42157 RepID=A0A182ESG4_ONCOC|nr:unnamed protein product [Onchocerca ochengi]VDM94835.1 unnamed protein product [Onchocerca ochengi]